MGNRHEQTASSAGGPAETKGAHSLDDIRKIEFKGAHGLEVAPVETVRTIFQRYDRDNGKLVEVEQIEDGACPAVAALTVDGRLVIGGMFGVIYADGKTGILACMPSDKGTPEAYLKDTAIVAPIQAQTAA